MFSNQISFYQTEFDTKYNGAVTRVTGRSGTLIALIIVSDEHLVEEAGTVDVGISAHRIVDVRMERLHAYIIRDVLNEWPARRTDSGFCHSGWKP